jgi:hypothetical protein
MSIVRIPKRETSFGDLQTAIQFVLREDAPHSVTVSRVRKLQNHRRGKHVAVVPLEGWSVGSF